MTQGKRRRTITDERAIEIPEGRYLIGILGDYVIDPRNRARIEPKDLAEDDVEAA